MKRVHIWISGKVQGVFFRHHTKKLALELGVNGWVKNLPDGRVEAVFEGDNEKVEKMIEFCRRGPPLAEVENIEVKEENVKGEKGFEILY